MARLNIESYATEFSWIWWNLKGWPEPSKERGKKLVGKYIVGGKKKNSDTYVDECPNKQRDNFVQKYFTKDTVYTNQTGK